MLVSNTSTTKVRLVLKFMQTTPTSSRIWSFVNFSKASERFMTGEFEARNTTKRKIIKLPSLKRLKNTKIRMRKEPIPRRVLNILKTLFLKSLEFRL